MKKIVLFKKRKALLNRIAELEIEVGIEKEPEVERHSGLYSLFVFGSSYNSRLYKSVEIVSGRVEKLEDELSDLQKYLDVSYQKESKKATLVKKQEPEVKPKDWKDKIADAIEEAVEENCGY